MRQRRASSSYAEHPEYTLMGITPWLLVPSGCAALIYQVTWVRLLGLSMGSTSASVSTVLAAFFFGLALGSYFAEKLSRVMTDGLKTFAVLEISIGVAGVALLPVLLNLDHAMALLGDLGANVPARFFVSLMLLAIPTVCMGATFPVLAAALIREPGGMGSQVGNFYALNTVGAVLGALASGFVLTPLLGLQGAVFVACALNVCVGLGALYMRRFPNSREPGSPEPDEPPAPLDAAEPGHARIAVVLFFTGWAAIASEVGWTKYVSISTGATIYGFAAVLGIFLSGIALGSWAAKRYLQSTMASLATVAWGLAALGAALLLARVGLAELPGWAPRNEPTLEYLAIFLILFPATFTFGGLFPITLSMYCGSVDNLARRIGRGYAINTVGGILGSIAAGFWLIPQFGTDLLLSFTAAATLILSWLFIDAHLRVHRRVLALGISAALLAGAWQLPHLNYTSLIAATPYRFDYEAMAGRTPEFLFVEEGKAGVISVVTYDGNTARLQNNGVQESFLGLVPGLSPPFTEVLLGVVPYLLHPNPRTAFVLGFGGGTTVNALAYTPLQAIRVVELEPAVINAIAAVHGGSIPVLQDERVELSLMDARNALLVEGRRYDLIVSQPSHPWLVGSGNLFTRQFFEIVGSRLNDGGISAQWVSLFNMDATTLRSILQAYFQVFPHGFTLANAPSGDLLLLGSNRRLRFDYPLMERRMDNPQIRQALAMEEVGRPEELLWYFAMSRNEALDAAADMPANTDTRIFSEVRLAGMRVDPQGEEDPYKLVAAHSTLDVLSHLEAADAPMILSRAGRYFYRYFATDRTRQAIARLEELDPTMASLLKEDWKAWRESVNGHAAEVR